MPEEYGFPSGSGGAHMGDGSIGSVSSATPSIGEFETPLDDGPNPAHGDALGKGRKKLLTSKDQPGTHS